MGNSKTNGTNSETEVANELLHQNSLLSLRKAAKAVAKYRLLEFGDSLHKELIKILPDSKLWETQVEVIKALGLIDYKPSLPEVESICHLNKESDMVPYTAATAYMRLKRKDITDVQPVYELLEQKGYAVTCGALDALGYDRMMPKHTDMSKLTELCFDLRSPNPRGLSDPRYGLAAACAGWDLNQVEGFLLHCIKTGDAPVKFVAENALKGKYVKLR